jgi:hypothetical protein
MTSLLDYREVLRYLRRSDEANLRGRGHRDLPFSAAIMPFQQSLSACPRSSVFGCRRLGPL